MTWNQTKEVSYQMLLSPLHPSSSREGILSTGMEHYVFWLMLLLLCLYLFPLIDKFLSSAINIFNLVILAFASLGVKSLLGDFCYQCFHP